MKIEKLIAKAAKKLKGKASGTIEVVTWVSDFKKSKSGLTPRMDYGQKEKQLQEAADLHNKDLADYKLEVIRIGYGMAQEKEEWGAYLYLSIL